MSAFCLEVNLVLYVPRDRDSEADAEIDTESDAESDAEADVKANVNADLEADVEAELGSIGVVELVWPGSALPQYSVVSAASTAWGIHFLLYSIHLWCLLMRYMKL